MVYFFSLIICVIAGIISWNWIEPSGFGQTIVFIIVWGILTCIGYWILEIIYRSINDIPQN